MKLDRFLKLTGCSTFLILMSACGGGGDSTGGAGNQTGDEVRDALVNLGVNIEETPRLDDESEPLPDDYSPFGSSQSFDTIEEILLIGPQFENSNSLLTIYELQSQNDRPIYAKEDFFTPNPGDTPWAASVGATPANLRSSAAADIDGDGLDEVAVLYREGAGGAIMLQTYQENVTGGVIGFALDQSIIVSSEAASSLALVAGDFNGDGFSDFAVGLGLASSARVLFVENSDGTLGARRDEQDSASGRGQQRDHAFDGRGQSGLRRGE